MKNSLLLAAGVLAGSASAGVHKMKLQKIPLSEQLLHADIETHVQALGQKYMGPKKNDMVQDTSIKPGESGHPVPVENFTGLEV